METRLNQNQIDGDVGGGGLVGSLYVDDLRSQQPEGEETLTRWIEISPGDPTAVKCDNNAEYIVEFRKPFSNDGTIFWIADIVTLHFAPGIGLESYNWQNETNQLVMHVGRPAEGIPTLDDYGIEDTIRIRCVVNGTTRTWYYDVGGVWTALTHEEEGAAVPSSYTDTGIDTASTGPNMLLNNPWNDNPGTCCFGFSGFKVIDNGATVFDGSKAISGRDYRTLRKDGDNNTRPSIIKLTHYL